MRQKPLDNVSIEIPDVSARESFLLGLSPVIRARNNPKASLDRTPENHSSPAVRAVRAARLQRTLPLIQTQICADMAAG